MAVNCSVRPLATDGLSGVTAIEVSAAAVTVRVSSAADPAVGGRDGRRAGGQRRGQAGCGDVATEAVADAQVT